MSTTTTPPKWPTALEMFDKAASHYDASTAGCTLDVARHILSLVPPITSSSVVLDNACGTACVAQEILRLHSDAAPSIVCADGAPNMLSLARKLAEADYGEAAGSVKYELATGEDLKGVLDASVTHSITNFGILFFTDPAKGAGEIYRTLAPGGTAVVTSWASLGYLPPIREAQAKVAPETQAFDVPLPKAWFEPAHMEKTMREAGFKEVEISSYRAWYAGETAKDVAELLVRLTGQAPFMQGRHEEVKVELERSVARLAKRITRTVLKDGRMTDVQVIGVPMDAIVAVCKK